MPRAAGAGVVFGGVTRDGWPVVLAISPDAKRLRGSVIALVLRCTSGAVFADADGFGGLAVGPRGNVHVAGSIPAVTTPAVSMTGGSHAMVGTLNRRRETFSGRWRLRLNFKLDNGQINHCDSGWVGFSARL